MSRWRLLIDDGAEATGGLATDEALMLSYARDAPDTGAATLRLYTYRSHCALIGRFQSLDAEVDMDVAARRGIEVARRPTGGGAIIMGDGQLGVAVATRAPAHVAPKDLLAGYAYGIVSGLARIGIGAEFAGKNDLQVDGRKIAGLGLHIDQLGALLFHASVLVDLDVPLMLDVLNIPGAKLADKPVDCVRQRVTTVCEELGADVPLAEVRDAIHSGFCASLDAVLRPSTLADTEVERRDVLVATRYGDPAWTRQQTPLSDAHGTAVLKTPAGLLRIYVATHGTTIKNLLVTGDFNVVPAAITALEGRLRWAPATLVSVRAAVEGVDVDADVGIGAAAVSEAVWHATERALGVAADAHPVRPSGSCYFPDWGGGPAVRSTTSTTEPELV